MHSIDANGGGFEKQSKTIDFKKQIIVKTNTFVAPPKIGLKLENNSLAIIDFQE